jgi:threonine/homoserine/homoserine lactone efflux protein
MIVLLLTIVGLSLTGVMAPGPVTAATLAAGARRRHAGAWICAGHVLVELPLILLLAAGLGTFRQPPETFCRAIALLGGLLLLLMGLQLLAGLRQPETASAATTARNPLWIGVVLSGANPYFFLWWAWVGAPLVIQAMRYGVLALGLFALAHWLCDLGWLEMLSLAAFKGSALGRRSQKILAAICAAMLLGFGLHFIYGAATGIGPV